MSNNNDGGLAFPGSRMENVAPPGDAPSKKLVHYPGMTLRDYFAGQALAGLANEHPACGAVELAADAYAFADAMLAQRGKETL